MRILITNDDGILAPGLRTLASIAEELAGPAGEVWTVAPANEASGVAHCLSYTKPYLITEHGPRRFSVEGFPADCVLTGLTHVMPEMPDLILSGVNRGNNSAENTVYSGTIGAAMEGALAGVPSVALSQYYGPANAGLDDPFEAAAAHGASAVQACLKAGFPRAHGYATFYNVNFPPVRGSDVKGMKACRQGYRRDGMFGVKPQTAPNGRTFLFTAGSPQQDPTGPQTDAALNLDGYVSITPMRCDLTADDHLSALEDALA